MVFLIKLSLIDSNRRLEGIEFAMSFLERWQRRQQTGETEDELGKLARGKNVIVLGGGDTGVDCIATALRQGAKSIKTLEILPPPPPTRDPNSNPWPQWPRVWRVDYGHEEVALHYGRDPRHFNIVTKRFLDDGNGHVCGLQTIDVEWTKSDSGQWKMNEVAGTEQEFECELVLLAMGFLGPEKALIEDLGLAKDVRSNIKTERGRYDTSVEKVYAAGDCRRGQSLVVHAINEGRQCARAIDLDLMGQSQLAGPGGLVELALEANRVAA